VPRENLCAKNCPGVESSIKSDKYDKLAVFFAPATISFYWLVKERDTATKKILVILILFPS